MTHLKPRSVIVAGRRTTVRLELRYWEELQRISRRTGRPIAEICTSLDQTRTGTLASALRVFVLDHYAWVRELPRGGVAIPPDQVFSRPAGDPPN